MEANMRLKEADSAVDIPGSRLHIHNVDQRDRNRNQSTNQGKLPDSGIIHCSTQWANNYVTSPNTTTCTTPTPGKEHLTNNGSNFNNNITASFQRQHRSSYSTSSEFLSESSPDDSLGDFEDGQQSSSSLDVSPQGDEYRCFSQEDLSDSESLSDDGNCRGPIPTTGGRGIVNPNYPGFQHLAHQLHTSDSDETDDEGDTRCNNNYNNNNNNNNNNNGDENAEDSDDLVESKIDSVNHLDSVENFQKAFYDKPKFNIPVEPELDCYCGGGGDGDSDSNVVVPDVEKDLNVSLPESDKLVVEETFDCEKSKNNSEESETACVEKETEVLMNNMAAIALSENNIGTTPVGDPQQLNSNKMSDAFLSGAKEDLLVKAATDDGSIRNNCEDVIKSSDCNNLQMGDSNRVVEEWETEEKFCKEEQTASEKEKDEDSVVPRKKEKMEINYSMKKSRSNSCTSASKIDSPPQALPQEQQGVVRRREFGPRSGRDHVLANRRSVPAAARDKKRSSTEILGGFDVYNIETAMPKIDLDAIESHLRAAREEERRRRNDREEIRRRLAMGSDTDEYYGGERPGRKPSLQARLQSGMNLQICFMNETVSDTESPGSDTETASSPIETATDKMAAVPRSTTSPIKPLQVTTPPSTTRPSTSLLTLPLRREPEPPQPMTEADFFARQARLQAEARMALAQAKEMAHMQMEVERQRQKKSPITEMVRSSLEKVGIPFPEDRRRVSRQILTEMNVAQLQVIVNDLHTQIEILNEGLVKFLMDRDDLHMEQDSMLVDIEDLTRYLGAKEQTVKEQKDMQILNQNNNNHLLPLKPKINRIAGLVKK